MATEQIPTDLIADDAVSTDKIANDASISTSGNIVTTGSGTLTVAGASTFSGGIANAGTITAGTFNGTLGTSASGGNSTEFVRNVDVQAMTGDVNTLNTSAMTTVHTFTYTPKVSGTSRVYADLYCHGFTGANRTDNRIRVLVQVTGTGITDRTLNSDENSLLGMYDYGTSGIQARFATTLLCPRVTSTNTASISYHLKVQMASAGSDYEIFFYGNSDETETHIRFMEVA